MRNDVVAPFIPTGSGESANFKNKLEMNIHPKIQNSRRRINHDDLDPMD